VIAVITNKIGLFDQKDVPAMIGEHLSAIWIKIKMN